MNEIEPDRLVRWFDAYAARLVLYARQWIDRGNAEDVVQDVFLRLLSSRIDPTSEKAWLFTAVRNAAMSTQRSQHRRNQRERNASRPDWFEPKSDDLIDSVMAERAMEQLSPEVREVILLRIWGGLTLAEISKVTALPVSTLFNRYKVGLREIRHTLEMSCKMKPINH